MTANIGKGTYSDTQTSEIKVNFSGLSFLSPTANLLSLLRFGTLALESLAVDITAIQSLSLKGTMLEKATRP